MTKTITLKKYACEQTLAEMNHEKEIGHDRLGWYEWVAMGFVLKKVILVKQYTGLRATSEELTGNIF